MRYAIENLARFDVRSRRFQLAQFVLQVFFTGMTLGLFRTVIPVMSETEFQVPRDSYLLLASFVLAFGVVKSFANLWAGGLSNLHGRKRVLVVGWLFAVPIPAMLVYAADWWWIVVATVLLGAQQGCCWSMSQIAKLDLVARERHGTVIGWNEFAGYFGVALGGYLTPELVLALGTRAGLLVFSTLMIGVALSLASILCFETLPAAVKDAGARRDSAQKAGTGRGTFWHVSFGDKVSSVVCLAGLVEKFIDVLVWVVFPVYLYRRGFSLPQIGLITGTYAVAWGVVQLPSGLLADRVSLKWLINSGMVLCGVTALTILAFDHPAWWYANALIMGVGMGLLYPTLSTVISRFSSPALRAPAMGVYRFWRDFGYAAGSGTLGAVAVFYDGLQAAFVVTAVLMLLTALLLHRRCPA